MPRRKQTDRRPQRIMSFEEYAATPRTPGEIATYWGCLRALQRTGWVDEDLNITGPEQRQETGA